MNRKNKIRISAAILAGGKSSRMGEDKALLEIEGQAMIERVVNCARGLVDEVMIISDHGDAYRFPGVPVYPDSVRSCGPLAGILTALEKCQHSHCLILACDLPFISLPLITFLVKNHGDEDIFVPESGPGVEPLCAVYSKDCLPVIKKQFAIQDYQVSHLFSKVNTRRTNLEELASEQEPFTFLNVNTHAELAAARDAAQRTRLG